MLFFQMQRTSVRNNYPPSISTTAFRLSHISIAHNPNKLTYSKSQKLINLKTQKTTNSPTY